MAAEHNTDLARLHELLWPTEPPRADRPHDRVVAIVCVSYIEKYLGELIKSRMTGANSKLREKLFNPDGLLGPLAARIDVARGLGLIDQPLSDDLKKMASIRNLFAHSLDIDSFDHDEIAKRFDAIKIIGLDENIPGKGKALSDLLHAVSSRAEKFRQTGWRICAILHDAMGGLGTPEVHGPVDE